MTDAVKELKDALRDTYRRMKDDCGYPANRFLQMIDRRGPVETAIELVMSPKPSRGFVTLQTYRRLDLAVEAIVLRDEFSHLFGDEVKAAARRRLTEHGYDPQSTPRND